MNRTHRTMPIINLLISNHYCTYKELRDEYDLDEFLDLYEMCMVQVHNKMMALTNSRKEG